MTPSSGSALVKPRVDSIWTGNFSPLSPSDFGTPEFHGRFHPEIVAQGIARYIDPEKYETSLVFDPMAGGGTTGDVCKAMGVPCIMSDQAPVRDDIQKFDILKGELPEEVRQCGVDLLVLHPPYIGVVDYNSELSSAKTVDEFAAKWWRVVQELFSVVKPGGHVICVIGNVYQEQEQIPLDWYVVQPFRELGFKIRWRVLKDFGETKGGHKRGYGLFKSRALRFGFGDFGWEQVFYLRREL